MVTKTDQQRQINIDFLECTKGCKFSVKRSINSIVDPELNINTKSELIYYINFPDNYNPEKKYPLIISIDGYGGQPTSEYQEKKLRPYLSQKYEAIVLGVSYHCINRASTGTINYNPESWETIFNLAPGEFSRKYAKGKSLGKIITGMFNLLVERKITRVSPLLSFQNSLSDTYSSFGFLPAIEHLHVIHDVISTFQIDLSNINILGTSYGGYIALLMGKYAPHTFNLIIDNSGFIATQFSEIFPSISQTSASYMRVIDGIRYELPVSTTSIWENDEFSERYFSDANKMIRNVAIKSHMIKSATKYYSYHSQKDKLVPFPQKKLFYDRLKDFAYIDLTEVTTKEVDGKLFKDLDHGMNASLRNLFDITYKKSKEINIPHEAITDFHLNSHHVYYCHSKIYEFSYDINTGLTVNICLTNPESFSMPLPTFKNGQQMEQRDSTQDSSKTNTITLLPKTFTNELFEKNLVYLKKSQSALYNLVVNHKCQDYWLCSNQDGSPNIMEIKSKQLLYRSFTLRNLMEYIRNSIENLTCHCRIGETYIGGGQERWREDNKIQVSMLDKLYEAGIFSKLKLTDNFLTPLQGYSTNYFPLLRVNGIGLGFHLVELIKNKNISYMTVYEPHIDLFFTSLYTIPWEAIFKYFDRKGKGVNLVVGTTPKEAVKINSTFIQQRLMPLASLFYRLDHLTSDKINEINTLEPQSDFVERAQFDAGWYEDQCAGFYLSAKNIKKGNKFFSGKNVSNYFRAFIVGSGPSLNETIQYIKMHQNDAIIVSCGTAITPLLEAGIIPDYEVVQERDWQYLKLEERHELGLLKKISLFKLNVVSTKIDKHYKETLVFQKYRDPGSSLLWENYPATTAVNPTVTNAGTAMCAALGVKEVYLFGVDYGAPETCKKMHAANTMYDDTEFDDNVESNTQYNLPSNLGAIIRTDSVLSWAHQTTEMKIAEYPNILWFNVGEGALISGAKPMRIEDLPKKFSIKMQKDVVRREISDCFNNNYSPTNVLERVKKVQMQQVEDYLQALLGFSNSFPKTREEVVNVLSLMYKALTIGQGDTHFLPTSLLSYGLRQFITDTYIQNALEKHDEAATNFFEIAKIILQEHIDDIKNDLSRILRYIDRDSETDLRKV
jgi:predicted peptidase